MDVRKQIKISVNVTDVDVVVINESNMFLPLFQNFSIDCSVFGKGSTGCTDIM